MFDASVAGVRGQHRATADLAAWCHERGVFVEAELGEIGGKDGVHAAGARTEPAEAAASSLRPAWTRWPSPSAARTRC